MGTATGADLDPTWTFTELDEVELSSRPAVIVHHGRVWVATRTPVGEVVCWDFDPALAPPTTGRWLDAVTRDDVTIGPFAHDGSVEIVVRREDGHLLGRRLTPTP